MERSEEAARALYQSLSDMVSWASLRVPVTIYEQAKANLERYKEYWTNAPTYPGEKGGSK